MIRLETAVKRLQDGLKHFVLHLVVYPGHSRLESNGNFGPHYDTEISQDSSAIVTRVP